MVKDKISNALDRSSKPRSIPIDPQVQASSMSSEYVEVLKIIGTSNLVGQAIIAYFQRKACPEIALHFIPDKSTMAIECGNLDIALETAEAVNKDEV